MQSLRRHFTCRSTFYHGYISLPAQRAVVRTSTADTHLDSTMTGAAGENQRVTNQHPAVDQVGRLSGSVTVTPAPRSVGRTVSPADDLLDDSFCHSGTNPFLDQVAVFPSADLKPQLRNTAKFRAVDHGHEVKPWLDFVAMVIPP